MIDIVDFNHLLHSEWFGPKFKQDKSSPSKICK